VPGEGNPIIAVIRFGSFGVYDMAAHAAYLGQSIARGDADRIGEASGLLTGDIAEYLGWKKIAEGMEGPGKLGVREGKPPRLSSKASDLLSGKDVRVNSIKEADALLEEALPKAQKVTGTGPGQSGPPDWTKFKGKDPNGIYHKDYQIDPKTGRNYGHGADNPHGGYKHVNIKLPDGRKVTIIIEPQ
jgi:hypothetical protein